jgi:hypothetical protein
MRSFIKPCIAIALTASLLACSESKNKTPAPLDVSAVLANASTTSIEKSDQLTNFAEELLTPVNFMHADVLLDKALIADSENKTAQLLKRANASQMLMRGFYTRIKPYLADKPKAMAAYKRSLKMLPEGDLRTFLLDGQEDIKTDVNLQDFLASFIEANDKFRLFVKANKETPFTINVPVFLNDKVANTEFNNDKKAGLARCAAEVIGDIYKIKECPFVRSEKISLNKADMEALQHAIAGAEILGSLATAYDMSSVGMAIEKFAHKNTSPGEVWSLLRTNSDFGLLRSASALKAIPEMGLDAIAGVRWAMTMQKEICPKGKMAPDSRPHMLARNGLCIPKDDEFSEILSKVEAGLTGNAIIFHMVRDSGNSKSGLFIKTTPLAVFDAPIGNLQDLAPVFDKCNKLVKLNQGPLKDIVANDINVNDILELDNGDVCK